MKTAALFSSFTPRAARRLALAALTVAGLAATSACTTTVQRVPEMQSVSRNSSPSTMSETRIAETALEGGNIELAAFDHPEADSPLNSGEAIFDLYNHQVVQSSGVVQRDIEQHPNYWQKVWIDLTTSDGQFLIAVRPARRGTYLFDGDGRIGVILGGIEAEPLD